MKNIRKCLLLILIFMISYVSTIGAQETISRIEINVDPFFIDHSKGLEKSDLDSAALKIIVYDSYLLHFKGDKFYTILSTLTPKDRVNLDKNAMDYRVECIVFFTSGRSEYFLMDRNGIFLLGEHQYYKKEIKEFVFDHIPLKYKDE